MHAATGAILQVQVARMNTYKGLHADLHMLHTDEVLEQSARGRPRRCTTLDSRPERSRLDNSSRLDGRTRGAVIALLPFRRAERCGPRVA